MRVMGRFPPAPGFVVDKHGMCVHQDLVASVAGAKANVRIAETNRKALIKTPKLVEHICAEQEAGPCHRTYIPVG